jgi:hypothetical protein
MSFQKDVYENNDEHCVEFTQGLKKLKDYSIHNALEHFQLAYESVSSIDLYHNKYASFCGLLRVLSGDRGGLSLCRDAVRSERYDGDVYLNLACVEWHMRSRRKSVMAIEKGLKIDKRHPGLKKMKSQIGFREKNTIPFLARNNPVNKVLGKLKRKKEDNKQWDLPHIL